MRALSVWQPWASDARHVHALGVPIPRPAETFKLDRCLPLGVVVCVATLVDCVAMTPDWIDQLAPLERGLGYYATGRHGWVLENVRPLAEPYPARGRQGLWRLNREQEKAVRRQVEVACG